jgi:hypothetical protein
MAVPGGAIGIDEVQPVGLAVPCTDLRFRQYRRCSKAFGREKVQIVHADAGKEHVGIDVRFLGFGGDCRRFRKKCFRLAGVPDPHSIPSKT